MNPVSNGTRATRVWFVTDLHGSNLCFRKFVNSIRSAKRPDVLLIGGDIAGKYLIPIVRSGSSATAQFAGEQLTFNTAREIASFQFRIAETGVYSWVCDREGAERLVSDADFQEGIIRAARIERLKSWMTLADERLVGEQKRVFVNTGNDDPWYLDSVIEASTTVVRPEGLVVDIDDYVQMISCGFANQTPWACPRDVPEPALRRRIDTMAHQVRNFERCIFNLHCPPYGTQLDKAPTLDKQLRVAVSPFGVDMTSVGSTAVRAAVDDYQPVTSLHGHIHEPFAYERLGKTLAFNPGSEYSQGLLRGVYLEFLRGELVRYELTRE